MSVSYTHLDVYKRQLLDALCTNTDSVEYQKPVPGDVTITDWSLESNQLFLHFNDNYSKMQSTDEEMCIRDRRRHQQSKSGGIYQ